MRAGGESLDGVSTYCDFEHAADWVDRYDVGTRDIAAFSDRLDEFGRRRRNSQNWRQTPSPDELSFFDAEAAGLARCDIRAADRFRLVTVRRAFRGLAEQIRRVRLYSCPVPTFLKRFSRLFLEVSTHRFP